MRLDGVFTKLNSIIWLVSHIVRVCVMSYNMYMITTKQYE